MNYFGLMSKQEAKEVSDLRASMPEDQWVILESIATSLSGCQHYSPEVKEVIFNQVVHDNVAGYFKNTMQYSVTDNKNGQPPNMTLLVKINWNQ